MVKVEHFKRKTMKNLTITLTVAIATLFAFSSCQKETFENIEPANNIRTITGTFENNSLTKTTLNSDGKTPEWAVGDVIRVLNAISYQDVTLEASNISDNTITFTTSLVGALYAVYPASVTTMESCGDGNITFTIPAIQDGTFASANICVAKSTEEDENNKDNLIFSNATAVLKITTADDVVGVDVTATNSIAGTVSASFDGNEVNLTTSALDKNYVSAVGSSASSDNIFYFAVAPVETGSTVVNCYKTETKGSENKSSKELQRNIIYTMDLSSLTIDNSDLTGQRGILNGHEYVVVKCGDKNLKWATKNIGADSETDYGYYFFWAGTEAYVHNGSGWEKADGPGKLSGGFKRANAPYYASATYPFYGKYNLSDPKLELESVDDAAQSCLGVDWRMPTSNEFNAMKDATYWAWDDTDKGCYVYFPNPSTDGGKYKNGEGSYSKSNALLFFPAAGYGYENSFNNGGDTGYYWSSTSGTSDQMNPNPEKAGAVQISKTRLYFTFTERQRGCSIRAVSE